MQVNSLLNLPSRGDITTYGLGIVFPVSGLPFC